MKKVKLEISGGVANVTFSRPNVFNALDLEMVSELRSTMIGLERDPAVRCVVLRGEGKHFVAGGDLSVVEKSRTQTPTERALTIEALVHEYNRTIDVFRRMSAPVVASVQGGVAGAAVGLVAACDLVIASEAAFFWVAHVLHGSSNDGLVTYFLPRLMGERKALELALLGDRIPAATARELNIVNFVVPSDQLAEETIKLATRLANGPTAAYGHIKRSIYTSLENTVERQGRIEIENLAACWDTADVQEGVTAFFERREPHFTGR